MIIVIENYVTSRKDVQKYMSLTKDYNIFQIVLHERNFSAWSVKKDDYYKL